MKLKELFETKLVFSEEEFLNTSSHEIMTFFPGDSGLQTPVWICEIKGYTKPVLKISNLSSIELRNNFIVSIEKNPQLLTPRTKLAKIDIKPIYDWIKLNYSVLKKFWEYSEVGDGDVILLYKKIKKISFKETISCCRTSNCKRR